MNAGNSERQFLLKLIVPESLGRLLNDTGMLFILLVKRVSSVRWTQSPKVFGITSISLVFSCKMDRFLHALIVSGIALSLFLPRASYLRDELAKRVEGMASRRLSVILRTYSLERYIILSGRAVNLFEESSRI